MIQSCNFFKVIFKIFQNVFLLFHVLTKVCNKSIVLVNNAIKRYLGLKMSSWKFKDTKILLH